MADGRLRILLMIAGDIHRENGARVKYGHLADALGREFTTRIMDVSLHGFQRWGNALYAFRPDMNRWKEHLYQNIPAFQARSRNAARAVRNSDGIDLILQVGVLFDACSLNSHIPGIIYTDYTAILASRKPGLGRSPLIGRKLDQWIALERKAFENAAHICTRSNYVRNSIIHDYQIPRDRVSAVGGGINLDSFPMGQEFPGREAPTILFVGKDYFRKGGDILLNAFSQVRKIHPEVRLKMVTDIPGGCKEDLSGVTIIPGTWDRSLIYSLYQQASVFVLPSRLETWGDVLLEAMAFGLPCIGVRGEGMEDIIEDGKTGLLIDIGDVDSLVSALHRLLANPKLREEYGQSARLRAKNEFTWDQVVSRMNTIVIHTLGLDHALKGRDAVAALTSL